MLTLTLALLSLLPPAAFATPAPSPIEQACRSQDPVLVFDNFGREDGRQAPQVDVDGDTQPDLHHGQFVEKLVQLGGHRTVRLPLEGEVSLPDVEEKLTEVVAALEAGQARYSRINFSQEMPLKLAAFKRDIFPGDDTFPEATAQNIGELKDRILQKIAADRPDFKLLELKALFSRLEKLGVPFVVAAGNNGAGYVNLFSMMPGVVSVGALNVDGKKRIISADNALVGQWRRGSFVAALTKGGYDVNGDGAADFSLAQVSKGASIVEKVQGKKIAEAVSDVTAEFREWAAKAKESEFVVPNAALNILPVGLYRVEDIVTLGTITPGTARHFRASGKYFYKTQTGPAAFFFTDDGERIVYDPALTGTANQRNLMSGTSYAAPWLCK